MTPEQARETNARPALIEEMQRVLRALLAYADANTCPRDATHRGGWAIYDDPPPLAAARDILARLAAIPRPPADHQE